MNEKVCVIMSTYNGEKYLEEQLETILHQSHVDVRVFVRDDGSADHTIAILERYSESGRLEYVLGKNLGPAKSFMEAVQMAPEAEYYAFADQDDIWDENKLEEAIKKIKEFEEDIPVLYHSKVKVTNAIGEVIGMNGRFEQRGFLCGEWGYAVGCTVVFNRALMNFLKKHNPKILVMHDAWVRDVCVAIDGKIIYDTNSYIGYRQHGNNVVGGSKGMISIIKRRINYYRKRPRKLQKRTVLELLEGYEADMTPDKVERAKEFCDYDKSIKNTFRVLFERDFLRGRFLWRAEQSILVLLHVY